ncbi:MAG: multidrug MFS transporter [Lachnospiraceae bacterium]|nr:multidrug MFS transporter [Lachnospiraceae bacterium]
MIFVTVGTHEQQFDRLVKQIDLLKESEVIKEEVMIQTGFSTYEPKYCKWSRLLSFKEMQEHVAEARIVITHGGPSSFIAPLQIGKIPIVVPRQKKYDEHVNDHQLSFCKEVKERMGNIILVEEVEQLERIISKYDEYEKGVPFHHRSNNARFNENLEIIVEELLA